MIIPKVVYLFNDEGDIRVHRIPGYIYTPESYIPYLSEFFSKVYKQEVNACAIEDDYFENRGLNFLTKSPHTSNLVWGFYSHALKMRKDLDSLIEKAKAVHFLT